MSSLLMFAIFMSLAPPILATFFMIQTGGSFYAWLVWQVVFIALAIVGSKEGMDVSIGRFIAFAFIPTIFATIFWLTRRLRTAHR